MAQRAILLGEWLLQKKLLTPRQLEAALEEQALTGDFLGEILIRKKFIREEDLMKALSEQFQIPCLDLRYRAVDFSLAMRFTPALISEHQCLPIRENDSEILFAVINPLDAFAASMAEKETAPKKMRLVLVTPADMREALKNYGKYLAARQKRLLR